MKLEFLAEGAEGRPLLRMFHYTLREIEDLRQACRDLATHAIATFALHEQPWVEQVASEKFTWHATPFDVGVRLPTKGLDFVLAYSDEAWLEVEGKLEPFANESSGFNWLTNEGEVDVLISSDGLW